jgi:hypothetical protein
MKPLQKQINQGCNTKEDHDPMELATCIAMMGEGIASHASSWNETLSYGHGSFIAVPTSSFP